MAHKDFPTKDADAFSSFVQGRAFFQSYLGTGQGEELTQARDRFASATARDPQFDIAKLYLAVTQTELRDSDAAILALNELVAKQSYLPEAHVQLAYAHIKRYLNTDYQEAENELNRAVEASKGGERSDLIDLIEAYRVFLFAVRGGRGTDEGPKKRQYLNNALTLGNKLLQDPSARDNAEKRLAVQFEVNNALGIAYLWLGQWFPGEPGAAKWWDQSETHLDVALKLRPNSVRPLQNLGLLYMLRGDRQQGKPEEARHLYATAKEFVSRSLKLNPFDQYPHFQMALLSIKNGDWDTATSSVSSGKLQKGSVSDEKWKLISKAITNKEPSLISGLR